MPSKTTLETRSSFDDLSDLRADWDALARKQHWPMAEFQWLRACAANLSPDAQPLIYVLRRDGAIVGAAALTRATGFASPAMTIGATSLYEATPLLCEDPTAAAVLLDNLFSLGHPLILSRILDAERSQDIAQRIVHRRGRLISIRSPGTPFLVLPASTEAFVSTLSANRRSSLHRKRRKLDSHGTLKFDSMFPNEHAVCGHLADFEQLEERGWKGLNGSAVTQRTGMHAFFAEVLSGMARDHRVRIDRLALDGKTIAIQFGVVSDGRYFLIKPTFDETLKDFSPGNLLTFEAIKHSIAHGLDRYEFLGSEDFWKLQWTETVRGSSTWIYYPYNVRGITRFCADAGRTIARRLIRRLAPSRP